jgi:hypothetical protein
MKALLRKELILKEPTPQINIGMDLVIIVKSKKKWL